MNLLFAILLSLMLIKPSEEGCLYALGSEYIPGEHVFVWETLIDSLAYQVMFVVEDEYKPVTDVVWASNPGGFGGEYRAKATTSGVVPSGFYNLVEWPSMCVMETFYFDGRHFRDR